MATHTDEPARRVSTGERSRTAPAGAARAGRVRTAARFVKQLFVAAFEDSIDDVGAMMAYYAVLAIFPMIIVIITIALLVLAPATIQQGVTMATSTMPAATASLIAEKVDALVQTADAGFAIGGTLFAVWGASRGARALSTALNAMHGARETRSWIRRQVIAIAVTLGVAVVVVVALALLVAGPIAGHWVADRFGFDRGAFDVVWGTVRWIGAGVLVMIVWAVLYKVLPDTPTPFRVFTPGSIVGVVLWLAISALFGAYLGYFDRYEATYGALGAAVIFLTWLWLSNIALLFGAEINDVLARFREGRS